MSCDVGKVTEKLVNDQSSSFSNPSVALPTSQLIIQPFRCFAYVTAHSPTLLSLLIRHRLFTYVTWPNIPSLDLRHSLFFNPSVALPTSQFVLQQLPLLHLRHSSFSKPSITSPTSQVLHLRNLANLSVTSPTSQLILQPFRRFTYVTARCPTPSVASLTSQLILQPFRRFT